MAIASDLKGFKYLAGVPREARPRWRPDPFNVQGSALQVSAPSSSGEGALPSRGCGARPTSPWRARSLKLNAGPMTVYEPSWTARPPTLTGWDEPVGAAPIELDQRKADASRRSRASRLNSSRRGLVRPAAGRAPRGGRGLGADRLGVERATAGALAARRRAAARSRSCSFIAAYARCVERVSRRGGPRERPRRDTIEHPRARPATLRNFAEVPLVPRIAARRARAAVRGFAGETRETYG